MSIKIFMIAALLAKLGGKLSTHPDLNSDREKNTTVMITQFGMLRRLIRVVVYQFCKCERCSSLITIVMIVIPPIESYMFREIIRIFVPLL